MSAPSKMHMPTAEVPLGGPERWSCAFCDPKRCLPGRTCSLRDVIFYSPAVPSQLEILGARAIFALSLFSYGFFRVYLGENDMIIRIHSLPTAGNCSGASRLRSFRLSAGSLAISGTEKLFLKGMHFFSAKGACLGAKNPRTLGFSSKTLGKRSVGNRIAYACFSNCVQRCRRRGGYCDNLSPPYSQQNPHACPGDTSSCSVRFGLRWPARHDL